MKKKLQKINDRYTLAIEEVKEEEFEDEIDESLNHAQSAQQFSNNILDQRVQIKQQ